MKKVGLFAAALSTLVLITISVLYYRTTSSVPVLSGEIKLTQLKESVVVTTDINGIPHIEAKNEEDLFYAFGFVVAKERIFQLEMLRRIGSGRLSEMLGAPLVESDKLLRTLRLRKTMEEFLAKNQSKLDPVMLKLAQRFFDGMNEYAQTQPLPLEFSLLGLDRPEPFTLVDAMAVSGYMALSFAEGLIGDVLFSELAQDFSPEAVELLRQGIEAENLPLPDLSRDGVFKVSWSEILSPLKMMEDYFGLFHGSNSFVLSGSRTVSGQPILSNDPHIAFSSPSVWFEAHLKSPTYEVYGHFIPLVPFAILGHNTNNAWGITMAEVDDLDLFKETINENNEVVVGNETHPIIEENELIKVRFGSDVDFKVKRSIHGPFLNETMMIREDQKHPIALAWSFHHPENNVITAFYKLNRAKNVTEFREALSYAAAPALNISWVDKNGDIAWQVMSKIPLRQEGVASDVLVDGSDPKSQYLGYVPYEKNPHAKNPSSGVIVSTNYKPPYQADYPLDGYWQPSERYLRLNELLTKKEKWQLEELQAVMSDENTVSQNLTLKYLIQALKEKDKCLEWCERFEKWQGNSDVASVESSVFHMWAYFVMRETFADEMKDRYEAFTRIADYWHTFKNHMPVENSPWWDNKDTDKVEVRSDILVSAFEKALNELTNKFGSDRSNWRWGNLHTVTHKHPLSKIPGLGKIFDVGPYASGGGSFQVNNMSSPRSDKTFSVTLGPSTRRLIDMAAPEVSYGVLPTGNSGHILSQFYGDQAKMFVENRFRRQWLNISDVTGQEQSWQLILKP